MSSFDNPFTSGFAEEEEEEEQENVSTLEENIEATKAAPVDAQQAETEGKAQIEIAPLYPATAAAEMVAPLEPAPGMPDEAPHGPTFAVVEEEEDAPEGGPVDEENGEDEDDFTALLLRVADLETSDKMSDLHETTMRMTKKEEQTLASYIEAQKCALQKEASVRNRGPYSQRGKRERSDVTHEICNGMIDAFLENSLWDLVSQHANAHFLFLREAEARVQKMGSNGTTTSTGSSSSCVAVEDEIGEGRVAVSPVDAGNALESLKQSVQNMYMELRQSAAPSEVSEGSAKKLLLESKQQVSIGTHLLRMSANMEDVKQREASQKLSTLLLSAANETEKLLHCREHLRSQLDLVTRRTRPLIPSVQELTAAAVQREMEQTVRFIESSYLEQQQLGTNKQQLKQLADLEAVAGLVTLAQTNGISVQELLPRVNPVTEAELDELKKQLEEKEKLYDKLVMEVLFLRKCGKAHDARGVTQRALSASTPTLDHSDSLHFSSQQLIEENCELLSELVMRAAGAAPLASVLQAPQNEEGDQEEHGAETSAADSARTTVPLSAQLLSFQEAIASRQNTLNTLLSQNARLWQSMEHTALVARYVYTNDATDVVREFFSRYGVATGGLAELLDESFQSRASDQSTDSNTTAPLSLLDIQQQAIDAYQSCIQELHEAAQKAMEDVEVHYTGPRSRLQHEIAFWMKLLNCLDVQEVQKLYPHHPAPVEPFQNIPLHRLTNEEGAEANANLYHFLTIPRTNQSLLAPFKKQTEELRGTLKALRESAQKRCDAAQEKIDWYAQFTVSEVEQKLEEAKAEKARLLQQSKEAEAHLQETSRNAQKAHELQERLAKLRLRKGGIRAELLRKQQAVLAAIQQKERETREEALCVEERAAWDALLQAHEDGVAAVKREAEESAVAVKEEAEEPEPEEPAMVKLEADDNTDTKQIPTDAPPLTAEHALEEAQAPTMPTDMQAAQDPLADAVKPEPQQEEGHQQAEACEVKQENEMEEVRADAVKREPSPLVPIKEEPQWTPDQQYRADEAHDNEGEGYAAAAVAPPEDAPEATEQALIAPPEDEPLFPQQVNEEPVLPLPEEAEDHFVDNPFVDEAISESHTNENGGGAVEDEEAVNIAPDQSQPEQELPEERRENEPLETASPLDEESPLAAAPVFNEEEEPLPTPVGEEEMPPLPPPEQEPSGDVNVEDAVVDDTEAPLPSQQPLSPPPLDEEAPAEQQDEEAPLEEPQENEQRVDVETEEALPVLPVPVDLEDEPDNHVSTNSTPAEAHDGNNDSMLGAHASEAKEATEEADASHGNPQEELEQPSSPEKNGDYYNPFYNDESFT